MRALALLFVLAIAISGVGCTKVQATTGHVVDSAGPGDSEQVFRAALTESARRDLPCAGKPLSVGPLTTDNSDRANSFYADGCGRRAVYGFRKRVDIYVLVLLSNTEKA